MQPQDPDIQRWAHGQCHALTLAMHERTGWPILTLHAGNVRMGDRYLDQCGQLLHSGVVPPGGGFVDARGSHPDLDEVADIYLENRVNARWSGEMEPEPEDLVELLDRHDLLPEAVMEAHDFIDRRLSEIVPDLRQRPTGPAAS